MESLFAFSNLVVILPYVQNLPLLWKMLCLLCKQTNRTITNPDFALMLGRATIDALIGGSNMSFLGIDVGYDDGKKTIHWRGTEMYEFMSLEMFRHLYTAQNFKYQNQSEFGPAVRVSSDTLSVLVDLFLQAFHHEHQNTNNSTRHWLFQSTLTSVHWDPFKQYLNTLQNPREYIYCFNTSVGELTIDKITSPQRFGYPSVVCGDIQELTTHTGE